MQYHPEPFKTQDLFFAGGASTKSLEVPVHGVCNISVNPVSYISEYMPVSQFLLQIL